MGNVRMGPPKKLITKLRDKCNIDFFIETGTYYGSTAKWASDEFLRVKTIELSDELYNNALKNNKNIKNIDFIKGESQKELPKITRDLNSPAIFWLDAHYSGEGTAGRDYQCPLLEEIEAIGESDEDNYIIIDDARLFYSPPPRPLSAEDWPTISDITSKIDENIGNEYYITITEDVIIAVPPDARNIVLNYAQDVATEKSNKSKIERGVELVIRGIFDKLNTERNRQILKELRIYPVLSKIFNLFSTIYRRN
jgi:hypothetical protein